jgi:hypothetical protein
LHEVGVREFAHHAVGEIGVEPAIQIEILQADAKSPVGRLQAGEVRGLEHASGAGVEEERIPHVLGRGLGILLVVRQSVPEFRHATMVLVRVVAAMSATSRSR